MSTSETELAMDTQDGDTVQGASPVGDTVPVSQQGQTDPDARLRVAGQPPATGPELPPAPAPCLDVVDLTNDDPVTHVSETVWNEKGKRGGAEASSKFCPPSKEDFVQYQREIFDELDALREDKARLQRKVKELESKLVDYQDMKSRLQMSHDYHKAVAPFVAWYVREFPSYEDDVRKCQGQCGKTETDGAEIKKYTCGTRGCVDLHMCFACSRKLRSCLKCKRSLMNEEGWVKRRKVDPGPGSTLPQRGQGGQGGQGVSRLIPVALQNYRLVNIPAPPTLPPRTAE